MGVSQRVQGLQDRANRLRIHSIRATTAAGSGHPTSCCSAAELMAALFFDVMRLRPGHPPSPGEDRFILSKGHAAPVLYAAWAEAGTLAAEDLLTLRRVDSDLEGHPTPRLAGVEVATGSLGQGLSCGVGMAFAHRMDESPARVFVLLGDGECAEGSVWEAAAVAGHNRLDNLVAVVDVNGLGQTEATMVGHEIKTYARRFEAFGWRALTVDGHDLGAVVRTLRRAARPSGRPTAVIARTVKGQGIPDVAGRADWHGKALPEDLAKEAIRHLEQQLAGGRLPGVRKPKGKPGAPAAAAAAAPPLSSYRAGEEVATRQAYGAALAALGRVNPAVVVSDGEVKNSTYAEKFAAACPDRYVEAFIAEQNMVGMGVGLAASGKIPFVSSFACFLTRAFDQVRMAAISRSNLKLAGSHCGVSIGQDGPSQMGLEDLAMFRAVPGAVVLYPSDAVSAERCVALAAAHPGMVYIRTSRPKTAVLYRPDEPFAIGGLKVVREGPNDRVTVVAAGVTLHEALRAHATLAADGIGIRVIDLYSVAPVDGGALLAAARATGGRVLTVEDHYGAGGLGDAVLDVLGPEGIGVRKLAVREIPRSGSPEELLDANGLSARHIVLAVNELTGRTP